MRLEDAFATHRKMLSNGLRFVNVRECWDVGMLGLGYDTKCGPAGVFDNSLRLHSGIVIVLRRCFPNVLMHSCNHERRGQSLCCLQFELSAVMSFVRAASWLFGNWNQQGFWTLGTKICGCSKACHVINNVQQFVKLWKFPFGRFIGWNIVLTHFHKLAYRCLNGFNGNTMIAHCPIGWLIKPLIETKHGFKDRQHMIEIGVFVDARNAMLRMAHPSSYLAILTNKPVRKPRSLSS